MRFTYPCHVLSFFLAWVVPIEETVQAMLHRLNNNPSLPDHTALTPTQIADLLNFVLRSTYFKYNRALYEQQEGAPMGSPISSSAASLFPHKVMCCFKFVQFWWLALFYFKMKFIIPRIQKTVDEIVSYSCKECVYSACFFFVIKYFFQVVLFSKFQCLYTW